jgi:endonuclease/exonuclease/phosphatase family metal-dependent hydrolase
MAQALKLMTWNIQQLPAPFAPGDPESRATQVARAILDMPAREQPDVVAFNEVFNEDGRDRLLRMLKSDYPHFVKKLEDPLIDVEQDSGLMLFSKLPFLPLPTGGTIFYEPFPKAAGTDALAAKGVGVVRVAGPFDPTTIAFTHTQASSDDANTEHAEIRADQFAFIREILLKVADGNVQHYANSVIAGDLNVKGDPDDTSGEFNRVFAGASGTFGGDYDDGWRVAMHAPNDLTDYDPGYTQRDTTSLIPNRFDYQCTRRDANQDIGLVPHHMKTPFRLASEVTDHWSFYGHLHRISPNCSPATAVELLKVPPVNPAAVGSKAWRLQTNFRDQDMYHWVYINSAGTYSVFLLPALEVAAFRRSDFTNELAPTAVLSVTELPPAVRSDLEGSNALLMLPFGQGSVFSSREPFFFRIRGVLSSFSGKSLFGIVQHAGESPATAFVLQPHSESWELPTSAFSAPIGLIALPKIRMMTGSCCSIPVLPT